MALRLDETCPAHWLRALEGPNVLIYPIHHATLANSQHKEESAHHARGLLCAHRCGGRQGDLGTQRGLRLNPERKRRGELCLIEEKLKFKVL
jgi:hypothetical protein